MASSFSLDSKSSDSSVSGPFDVDSSFLKVKSLSDPIIAIYDSVIQVLAETKNQLKLTVEPLEEHEENLHEEYSQVAEWINNNRFTEKAQDILNDIEEIVRQVEEKSSEVKKVYKALDFVVFLMKSKADTVLEPMHETINW